MSENTIKFIQDIDGDKLEKTIRNSVTWYELSDEYFKFLIGCGYHLEPKDLADHFNQMVGE